MSNKCSICNQSVFVALEQCGKCNRIFCRRCQESYCDARRITGGERYTCPACGQFIGITGSRKVD